MAFISTAISSPDHCLPFTADDRLSGGSSSTHLLRKPALSKAVPKSHAGKYFPCLKQRWHQGTQLRTTQISRSCRPLQIQSAAACYSIKKCARMTCFRDHHKQRIRSQLFGQSFLCHNSRYNFCKVKSGFINSASLGPDEPHVASTTWPETFQNSPAAHGAAGFLSSRLPSHPKLYRGQLTNGFRYLILPNKFPGGRFEAHMEMHVGSVDEEEDEQGIAHMIEHVAFLGSRKREKLLASGARSNAYTDFHHTVFHIHSPNYANDSDGDLLPVVLDALSEIAFYPQFLATRVEKERKAILSELQMMNTIEYRVDCQMLQHLHSENKLSKRFPIGLEEQIKKWDVSKIKNFHERWYFPGNATLYIVGDIQNIIRAVNQIEAVFGSIPTREESQSAFAHYIGGMRNFLVPKLPRGIADGFSNEPFSPQESKSIKKERHALRPPVQHVWSIPGLGQSVKSPQIFQHELLQNFTLNMFCKVPVLKVQTYGDLRDVLMKRVFLSAFHFRINTRYKSSNPPFISVELDHSDSGREGCTVTTFTVTAEPQNWQNAVRVAVQEVRRLKEFGITISELTRYMAALLKDSEQLATMIDSVPSIDNLDFIMESDALGHAVMDQRQGHESLIAVAETVTLEEVNTAGARILEFISDFGSPGAPAPSAVVACVPEKVHTDGIGESIFNIAPHEIMNVIKAGLEEPTYSEPEVDAPKNLVSPSQLQQLQLLRDPAFVPLDQKLDYVKLQDNETGITQCRLSNGIRVNYKITDNEARTGIMRLVISGGRASEVPGAEGSVALGVRTLSEGGCVGSFSRQQIELFCVNHMINCSLESAEEFIALDIRFMLRDNGMCAAFQLLHMVLEHTVWMDDAFVRAVQVYLSHCRSIPKSLERSTAQKLMLAMMNGDERFVEPTPHSLQKLTLDIVKDALMNQFATDDMEVNIVGDFSKDEVETCILDYLGTISATKDSVRKPALSPIIFRPPTSMQFQKVFLKDTDERACAFIAGPAPNRWGYTVDGQDLFKLLGKPPRADLCLSSGEEPGVGDVLDRSLHDGIRGHPLFFGVALGLLAEVINSRLFTTVRDSLGLTYDVSFELNLFDILNFGWYVISVTSTPSKVARAVDACKDVLRGIHEDKIMQREVDRARRTLLLKHEAEAKSNVYWIGLLTHLQSSSVPRKDIYCIKELTSLYKAATVEDVQLAYEYLKVEEGSMFQCIGIAGSVGYQDDSEILEEEGLAAGCQGVIHVGRGLSVLTRPTS